MITKFKDFHYGSVGIVFHYGNMVLLVHPTGFKNNWSYPKGRSEKGEDYEDTALREVAEETGVILPEYFLNDKELFELNPARKVIGVKHYWYYKHNLTHKEFKKYFNGKFVIPKENLQLDEVDEARFVDIQVAKKIIARKFLAAIL